MDNNQYTENKISPTSIQNIEQTRSSDLSINSLQIPL